MKLIATMPVRNEDWILGLSGRAALMWCDELVILNHASEDGTMDILGELQKEHPGRVHVVCAAEAKWTEMQHRQIMLEMARDRGATHIAIVDADEILTGNLVCDIRSRHLTSLTSGIVELPGYNLRCCTTRYHANGTWGRRWFSTTFKDNERLYWSSQNRDGNYDHHHREPMGMKLEPYRPIAQGAGGVMHLWGANDRRLRAKHALYKMVERVRWPDKPVKSIDEMYSWAFKGMQPGEPENWLFMDVPAAWWAPYQQWMQYLHLYREPWQEAECRRLWDKHGVEPFKGLDLFSVI